LSSRHWYASSARNFICNDHPRQPKELAVELSEFTGMSQINTRHLIDKLRHLSHCLKEPESLTLFRLQQGANQSPPEKVEYEDE